MPEISKFYGIRIAMRWQEHERPHFHARYAGNEIQVMIEDGRVRGEFHARALRLVQEWRELRKAELLANWERAQAHDTLLRIDPLE